MFTGIIEEIGRIKRVVSGAAWGQLVIAATTVLEDTKLGDSIAVNGTCLTVTQIAGSEFTADVMAETMRRTNLGLLKSNDMVNLERAMAANGRFGGHMVSGHIDGNGAIKKMYREGNAMWVEIEAPPEVMCLVVEKGSIAIDGISLTVAKESTSSFAVSVIPHTGQETTLLQKKIGDTVNLETDIIGKYMQKLLYQKQEKPAPDNGRLTMDMLERYGY